MAVGGGAVERGAARAGLDVDGGGTLVEDEAHEGFVAVTGGPEERGDAVFVGDGDVVDYGGEEGGEVAGGELEGGEVFEEEVGGDEDYEFVWKEEEDGGGGGGHWV